MVGTVKEEAQRLRQNIDKVYAAGVASATSGELMTDINTALTDKGVEPADSLEQVPQRIGEIVVEEDFAKYAYSLKFRDLNLFGKKDITIDITNAKELSGIFTNMEPNTTVEHLTLRGTPTDFYFDEPFSNNVSENVLTHITFDMSFSTCLSANYFFNSFLAIETIDGVPLDLSSIQNDIFSIIWCPNLSYVRFAPNSIKKTANFTGTGNLSAESIQSIIDGLADLTGLTTQKIQFHSTVLEKLTDEQISTILEKNWTM